MKRLLDTARARWTALSPGRRVALGAIVAAIAIGGYVAYGRSTATHWAVLYANLDDETASEVMQELDARAVPHKLEANGSRILVPRDRLAAVRLDLAGEGISGQPVPAGFDEVFAGQGLATSDFEQRVNFERALEGELARTLLAMEPVQGASVQLSLPERSLYVGTGDEDTTVPTASVVLDLRRELTTREVDTVANVVASSVEGLTPEQVTIAATDGRLLRAAGADLSSGGATGAIEVTREYEHGLAQQLTELVRVATGAATSTVEVRAQLDFTSSNTEQEVIDPAANVPTAEQTSTETYEGTGAGAADGGTVGIDGGPIDATGGQGTYGKEDRTITYIPGNRTVTRSTSTAPTVRRLDIAVVVPVSTPAGETPVAPVDPATIQQLVSSAAGLVAERGDSIAIAVVPALATDEGGLITTPTPPPAASATAQPVLIAAAAAAGMLSMLLVGAVLRRRRKRRAAALAAELSELGSPDMLADAVRVGRRGRRKYRAAAASPAAPQIEPREIDGPDRQALEEIRADLEQMLDESPESLAALLSSWMAK